MRKWIILSALSLFVLFTSELKPQWTQVAMPGAEGGAVYSVAAIGGKLYAGIRGGIYISTDAGNTWKQLNNFLPSRESAAIPASISVANEIIVAAFNEPGVYITGNNGDSWIRAGINENLRATPFAVSTNGSWIVGGNQLGKTYQSTNKGVSWSVVPGITNIYSVIVNDSVALAAGDSGIYRSADKGVSWTRTAGFPASAVYLSGGWALAGSVNNNTSYLYTSTDGGNTWTINDSPSFTSVNSVYISTYFYFAATDSGLFRSVNYGNSWSKSDAGINSQLIFSITAAEDTTTHMPVLYAGTGNGIYTSADFGASWVPAGAPSDWSYTTQGSKIYALSSNSSFTGSGIFNNQSGNNYRTNLFSSDDNGNTWQKIYSGSVDQNTKINSVHTITGTGGEINILGQSTTYGEMRSATGGVYRFNSNDNSWQNVYSNPGSAAVTMDTHGPNIFISAFKPTMQKELLRSTDSGNNWTKSDTIYAMAYAFDDNKVYAGWFDNIITGGRRPELKYVNMVKVSADNGGNFQKAATPLDSGRGYTNPSIDTVSILTALYAEGDNLVMGLSAINFTASPYTEQYANGGGFYHFVKQGDTWSISDSALMGFSFFDFAGSGSNLFAATNSGVYKTTDYGKTWSDISRGMQNIYVSKLFSSGNNLYASTINGFWRRPLSQVTSVEGSSPGIPQQFALIQNYPNPFNPVTIIGYNNNTLQKVELKVYDVLGREVQTLVNELQEPGSYQVEFNAGSLASGIYFYRLTAGRNTAIKKMLLLK